MTNVTVLNLRKDTDIRNPEMLLERALPLITAQDSSVHRVTIYRLTRGGMVVWHGENSPYDDGAFVPLEANSDHQRAILQQQAVLSTDETLLIVPLMHGKDAFGVAEFIGESALARESLIDVADDLALLIYNYQTDELLRQQLALTGKLTISASFRDIATVIGSTILQVGQFVSITKIRYADDEVIGGTIVATANRKDGFQHQLDIEIAVESARHTHELLQTEGEVLVSDVTTDDRFSEAERQWFHQQRIKSLYMLPLWIHNRLDAVIAIADTARTLAPSDLEKELLHNIAHQAAILIEKQQLLDESQQSVKQSAEQVRVMRLINELISGADNDTLDRPLLQKAAEVLLDVTDADHIGIVMKEGDLGYLVSEAPTTPLIGMEIDTGDNSLYPLLRETQGTVTILDVANSDQLRVDTRETFKDSGIKSLMVLPMFDENNILIGSVGLDYYTQQANINENTVESAQTVVSQIALRLQKVNLLAESQQKATQLEKLTEFGQQLRAYLTLEEILATTLNYAPTAIDSDYTGILLYERATNSIRNSAIKFHEDLTINLEAKAISEDTNSIALKAWTSHELVQVDDLHSDWEWKHDYHRELQSIIAIPLTLAGVTLGVLEVGSVNPHHYSKQDVNTLQLISNQVAIALSNATAYAQSQRMARNKTQANDIISLLQQQLEVSDILQVTARELGKVLGAKKARIRLGTSPADNLGDKR